MALLSDKDREFVRAKFEAELKGEVKAVLFTQRESGLTVPALECPGCEHTRQLLEEVTSLSPKLVLETLDFVAHGDQAQALGVDKIPATVLHVGDDGRIRFFGVPSGYEFATLADRGHPGSLQGRAGALAGHLGRPERGHQAHPHPGLRYPHLTLLPPCGQAGPQTGPG